MAELTLNRPTKVTVKYLKAECGVRYWEDADVNGSPDDEDSPAMPFATRDMWSPLIDVDTGTIVDWPEGVTADVHYKVCDAGRYTLLDEGKNELFALDGYVPRIMSPKENGYGDYVIMDIGPDGRIADWKADFTGFEAEE